MKKEVKTFRMYENEDGNYKFLYLDLFPVTLCEDKPNYIREFANVSIKWQQSKTGELSLVGWYGMRINMSIKENKIADSITALKYVEKMISSFETYDPNPEMILSFLKEDGFKRIVWANHDPISETDHGKTIFISQRKGENYGKIYAFTATAAAKIAKKLHGTEEVKSTGEKIDFDTDKFQ